MAQTTGVEVAHQLSRLVNGGGRDEIDALVDEMGRDHRTLQQRYTEIALSWLYHLASADYDLRNEASVQFAKVAVKALEEDGRLYVKGNRVRLPFV